MQNRVTETKVEPRPLKLHLSVITLYGDVHHAVRGHTYVERVKLYKLSRLRPIGSGLGLLSITSHMLPSACTANALGRSRLMGTIRTTRPLFTAGSLFLSRWRHWEQLSTQSPCLPRGKSISSLCHSEIQGAYCGLGSHTLPPRRSGILRSPRRPFHPTA